MSFVQLSAKLNNNTRGYNNHIIGNIIGSVLLISLGVWLTTRFRTSALKFN